MILGWREGVVSATIKLPTGYPQTYPQGYPQSMFKAKAEAREASLLLRQTQDRCTSLEGDIRKLQTSQKHLELEWTELYDKVRHAMSRISKRAERAEKAAAEEPFYGNGPDPAQGEQLTDPISAKILARRQNRGLNK